MLLCETACETDRPHSVPAQHQRHRNSSCCAVNVVSAAAPLPPPLPTAQPTAECLLPMLLVLMLLQAAKGD